VTSLCHLDSGGRRGNTVLAMGDEKPNPLNDTLRGLGLLFRAARTVAAKIPTKNLEEVVATSAREVGRAFENVATTVATSIERGVLGKEGPASRPSSEASEHAGSEAGSGGGGSPSSGAPDAGAKAGGDSPGSKPTG
jgi:hypothetical protein